MIREVILWPDYVEVVYRGEVTADGLAREGPVAPEVLEAVVPLERVLYDASAVDSLYLRETPPAEAQTLPPRLSR